MNVHQILAIEERLSKASIYLDHEHDNNDILYFAIDGKYLECELYSLINFNLSSSFSEDNYSIELARFKSENICAIIFNQYLASGEYELIGVSVGSNPTKYFVEASLKRWTKLGNFQWPIKNLVSNDLALVPTSLLSELRAINEC